MEFHTNVCPIVLEQELEKGLKVVPKPKIVRLGQTQDVTYLNCPLSKKCRRFISTEKKYIENSEKKTFSIFTTYSIAEINKKWSKIFDLLETLSCFCRR